MFPEDEYGELASIFELPPNLLWCDFQTLLGFPVKWSKIDSSNSGLLFIDEDFLEAEIKVNFFITNKKIIKGNLRDCMNESITIFQFWGLSFICIQTLGYTLSSDIVIYPNNISKLNFEQTYKIPNKALLIIKEMSEDDLYKLAENWHVAIVNAYDPITSYKINHYSYYLGAYYNISHLTIDYLLDFLFNFQDFIYSIHNGGMAFFSLEY